MAREMVGARDFVAMQVPLFKKSQPVGATRPVTAEDFPILSTAYRAMLARLLVEVPNVDLERSVIGGHSNGAHTLAVLLAGKDEFITHHFRAFWLHEGGLSLRFSRITRRSGSAWNANNRPHPHGYGPSVQVKPAKVERVG